MLKSERLIIRMSAMRMLYFTLFSGAVTFFSAKELYESPGKSFFGLATLLIVFFGLFVYFLIKLIRRHPEIILTKEGIEIRDDAFYNWQMISSFETWETKYSRPPNKLLVIHFKEFSDIEIDITEWELNKDEVVDYILYFKGLNLVEYQGHAIR